MSDLRQALVRSCHDEGIYPQVVRLHATTFSAFRICDDEGGKYPQRTYEVGELEAATLPDAIAEALAKQTFSHKDHLLVREEGERGVRLHLYAIRRESAPRYVHRDHVTRREHRLYPQRVCTVDGGVLLSMAQQGRGSANNRPPVIR